MKIPKLKKFSRIEITWSDSIHMSGWVKLKHWEEEEKKDGHGIKHLTIGYVIFQDDSVITVCQSMNDEPAFTKTIDAIMTIPKGCIIRIKRL